MLAYEKEQSDAPYSKIFAEHGATFLGMVNKRGRIMHLPNPKLDLDDRKKEMFFMSTALINNMHQDFDDNFGPLECCVAERKSRKFVSIPTQAGILLVVMPKENNHETFVSVLRQTMESSEDYLKTS